MTTVVTILQTKDFATVDTEVDLDTCFDGFNYEMMRCLRQEVVRSMADRSNRSIAHKLKDSGIYSHHTVIVDVENSVKKIRRKLNLPEPKFVIGGVVLRQSATRYE